MANTTTIYTAQPNGTKGVQITHTNGVTDIEETLRILKVELIGYTGAKNTEGVAHTFTTPQPIEPQTYESLKKVAGVQEVLVLGR